MKYLFPVCVTIGVTIVALPHSAQASSYSTTNRTTLVAFRELPGGNTIGDGYYTTTINGQEWQGGFQATTVTTTVTANGNTKTYSGPFSDSKAGPGLSRECKGTIKLQRSGLNRELAGGPALLKVAWTIGAGGTNCSSPVGTMASLNLTEALPVANRYGNFLAGNSNTIPTQTGGQPTWPLWIVVDPSGLNCRATAPSGSVVTTFAPASTVDVSSRGVNSFVTAAGASWLRVDRKKCFIRANTSYVKPKSMPF